MREDVMVEKYDSVWEMPGTWVFIGALVFAVLRLI
jgi:hypothetical protein